MEIGFIKLHNLRGELEKMENCEIVAQQLQIAGASHALLWLRHNGINERNVTSMLEDLEEQIGLVRQIAQERENCLVDVELKFREI